MANNTREQLQRALAELEEISGPDSFAPGSKQHQDRVERRVVLLEIINKLVSLWYDELEDAPLRACVFRVGSIWEFSMWRAGSCIQHGDLGLGDGASEDDAITAAWRRVPAGTSATVVKISDLPARERKPPLPARRANQRSRKDA